MYTGSFAILAALAGSVHASGVDVGDACEGASPADTIFRNGSIYTMDKGLSKASAMAVKDGIITYVGHESGLADYIDQNTTTINLGGRALIPGLVDAHMHLQSGGLGLLQCNLNYQPLTWEQTAAHITGCAAEDGGADGTWLEVINMDYASLVTKSGSIDKVKLDAISDKRPILVRSSDRHTGLANSKALEASGITADTPDPEGGVIERLSGGKEPSGVLQDSAISLMELPDPTEDTIKDAVKAALKQLREAGITTFQEAASGVGTGTVFAAIEKEGGLTARGYFDYRVSAPSSVSAVPDLVKDVLNVTSIFNSKAPIAPKPALKWQAIKAFIDGVITYPASTAAVVEPYRSPVNGNPDSCSWAPDNATFVKPYWPQDVLDATIEQLILNGIDGQFHSDGDLAVRFVLNAVEAFRAKHPNATDYRIGIAHDELSHPDDWPRFSELGVDAIVSFQWAQMSAMFVPYTFRSFGPERKNYLEAWGNILEHGDSLVYGSDWPIDPLDEFLALKVAVTRTGDPLNPHSPAYNGSAYDGVPLPGVLISREEALRAITIRSASFLRADDSIGSLEAGKLADAIILERDYFEVDEAELGRNRVLLTMVGGEVVYVADGEDFGVEATFKNDDGVARKISARNLGGLHAKDLGHEGALAVRALRPREECHGGHGHH